MPLTKTDRSISILLFNDAVILTDPNHPRFDGLYVPYMPKLEDGALMRPYMELLRSKREVRIYSSYEDYRKLVVHITPWLNEFDQNFVRFNKVPLQVLHGICAMQRRMRRALSGKKRRFEELE
jgi:hypothetical protein